MIPAILQEAISAQKLRYASIVAIALTINAIFTIADPLATKLMIDKGLMHKDLHVFASTAVVLIVIGLSFRGVKLLNDLALRRVENDVIHSIVKVMLRLFYQRNVDGTESMSTGYYIARIYDEPIKIVDTLLTICLTGLISSAAFVCACGICLYLDWRLTITLLLLIPGLIYLAKTFRPAVHAASTREAEYVARARDILGRAVNAFKTVRLFSLTEHVESLVEGDLVSSLTFTYGTVRAAKTYETLSQTILALAEVTVLILAGYEVVNGHLTIGALFAFMNVFWKLITSGTSITSAYSEFLKLAGPMERLETFSHHHQAHQAEDAAGGYEGVSVALEDVTVRYATTTVLSNVSLTVRYGEKLLICGPNGSGKSTLANLMTGFIQPAKGNIRRPQLARISAAICPFAFIPGSLKDNVDHGRLGQDQKRQFELLVASCGLDGKCDSDIEKTFSEGEKARAQLVMVLLKDADLYVLDEPLAHIDSHSKEHLLATSLKYTEGRTVVYIMHGDVALRKYFDSVVYMDVARHGVSRELCNNEQAVDREQLVSSHI